MGEHCVVKLFAVNIFSRRNITKIGVREKYIPVSQKCYIQIIFIHIKSWLPIFNIIVQYNSFTKLIYTAPGQDIFTNLWVTNQKLKIISIALGRQWHKEQLIELCGYCISPSCSRISFYRVWLHCYFVMVNNNQGYVFSINLFDHEQLSFKISTIILSSNSCFLTTSFVITYLIGISIASISLEISIRDFPN